MRWVEVGGFLCFFVVLAVLERFEVVWSCG